MVVTILIMVLVTIVTLIVGGGLFILIAYGIGWVVNYLTGFGLFPATVLGLAGIFVFVLFVDRIVKAIDMLSSFRPEPMDDDDDDEEEEDDDEEDESDDYEIVEDEEALNKLYAGIPRWRRPTRTVDFSNAEPDARCPCGSGRKYKNCHGAKQKKI